MKLARWLSAALAVIAIGAVALVALGVGHGEAGPPGVAAEQAKTDVEIPRVCWFSDYKKDPPGLSNKCRFVEEDQAWVVEVDGEWLPAKGQPLPVANLCHYFYGQTCPPRD